MKMPYKGRLKYRGAPEVETERGFEWKEADRNWKRHIATIKEWKRKNGCFSNKGVHVN